MKVLYLFTKKLYNEGVNLENTISVINMFLILYILYYTIKVTCGHTIYSALSTFPNKYSITRFFVCPLDNIAYLLNNDTTPNLPFLSYWYRNNGSCLYLFSVFRKIMIFELCYCCSK